MVLFISCICGIVLVELKLLQVLCNRSVKKMVVLKPAKERERERRRRRRRRRTYSGGQKAPLKVHIL